MNLHQIIPPQRPKIYDPRIVLWALFGNDEDGIYGERSVVPTYGKDAPQNTKQFLRWWTRNPFHNLFFHVLSWPVGNALILVQGPPFKVMHRRPPTNWVSPGKQVIVSLVPLFFSWRVAGWEGYIGWRESGELGAAFRKAG